MIYIIIEHGRESPPPVNTAAASQGILLYSRMHTYKFCNTNLYASTVSYSTYESTVNLQSSYCTYAKFHFIYMYIHREYRV